MNTKSLSASTTKWSGNASNAGQAYSDGVNAPRRPWAAATQAAETNYEQGVTASIARKAFGKGVANAGDATWKDRASTLGAGRFASGVLASENNYSKGFAPYLSVISGLSLPPRGSKGSPANLQRVAVVANALRKQKTG